MSTERGSQLKPAQMRRLVAALVHGHVDPEQAVGLLRDALQRDIANVRVALDTLKKARRQGVSLDVLRPLRDCVRIEVRRYSEAVDTNYSQSQDADSSQVGLPDGTQFNPFTDAQLTDQQDPIASADAPTEVPPEGAARHSSYAVALGNRLQAAVADRHALFQARDAIGDPLRPGIDREWREGDLLRRRFELVKEIGKGGMGSVWKGIDHLKKEALDRNPYVAIKLLKSDFVGNPEAFIALQREAAKQQRLAHPNIATVFDFDRDDATDTVFMTMEVLEGAPLDRFIRNFSRDGLPVEDAMALIHQLCEGLEYAHENGLVHADLKPGNCFVTADGTIKLLDFGIARASNAVHEPHNESTVFDPGQLGGITPAYASLEMFQDHYDPDPRDDVFGLAIIAYLMFTGRHPYHRLPAPEAEAQGLVPAPVPGLSAAQNKWLRRGLAFKREDRPASVEEFRAGLDRRNPWQRWRLGLGLAASLLFGVALYNIAEQQIGEWRRDSLLQEVTRATRTDAPTMDHIALRRSFNDARNLGPEQFEAFLVDNRLLRGVRSGLLSNDPQTVERTLAFVTEQPLEWQRKVCAEPAVEEVLIAYLRDKVQSAFNPNRGQYDFQRAEHLLTIYSPLVSDRRAYEFEQNLSTTRTQAIASLRQKFTQQLTLNRLISNDELESERGEASNADQTLKTMLAVDPESGHIALARNQFAMAAAEAAFESFDSGEVDHSEKLVRAGLQHLSDHPELLELQYRIERFREVQSDRRKMANLLEAIEKSIDISLSPANSRPLESDLVSLAARDGAANLALALPSSATASTPDHLLESQTAPTLDSARPIVQIDPVAPTSNKLHLHIEALRTARPAVVELYKLDREHPALRRLERLSEASLDEAITTALDSAEVEQAYRLLAEFSSVLASRSVMRLRAKLDQVSPGSVMPRSGRIEDPLFAEKLQTMLATLNRANVLAEESRVLLEFKLLVAQAQQRQTVVAAASNAIQRLNSLARDALQNQHFELARRVLFRAASYLPEPPFAIIGNELGRTLDASWQALAKAERAHRERIEAQEKLARITSYKARIVEHLAANEPTMAESVSLDLERIGLARSDNFLSKELPDALASAYTRLSEIARDEGELPLALAQIENAMRHLPGDQQLQERAREIGAELEKRQAEYELRTLLSSSRQLEQAQLQRLFDALALQNPDEQERAKQQLAVLHGDRIFTLSARSQTLSTLAERLRIHANFFPEHFKRIEPELVRALDNRLLSNVIRDSDDLRRLSRSLQPLAAASPTIHTQLVSRLATRATASIERAVDLGDLERAGQLLSATKRELGNGFSITESLLVKLPPRELVSVRVEFEQGRLSAAEKALRAARQAHPKHPAIAQIGSQIEAAQASVLRRYQANRSDARRSPKEANRLQEQCRNIVSRWRDRVFECTVSPEPRWACSEQKAGRGSHPNGTCFDRLGGRLKGPLMVVVPSGGQVRYPFAIGKFEVSGREFDNFCRATARCASVPRDQYRLPVTNVSVNLMRAYTSWLSKRASETAQKPVIYRLPREEEWAHAAAAGGRQPKGGFNCTVHRGNEVLAGQALVNARSGKANGWGLSHYVGNAEEVVESSRGLIARGAHFKVPLTRCRIEYSRRHNGLKGASTGFRLVRELG